ncbi:MAG: AraC family transcriptional regulator [Bacteroidales bacterium]|nr:AraC family transcriptional regulator [Bacteroidales bacterium]
MKKEDFEYTEIQPDARLADFVEIFWMNANNTENDKEFTLFPDGGIDIIFTIRNNEPVFACLNNIDRKPKDYLFTANTMLYGIRFTLFGAESFLNYNVANMDDSTFQLPLGFWDINNDDLRNTDTFTKKITEILLNFYPSNIDERKRHLFQLIYSTAGSLTVKELSEKVCWSSRQINRYFNHYFGISLKSYCTILRFWKSVSHLKEGEYRPQLNYADQAHFIKEVKHFTNLTPTQLSKRKNDRFIQFSTFSSK